MLVEGGGVVHARRAVPVDDDRELGLVQQLEVGRLAHRVGEQPREPQVVLDRRHEGIGAVGPQRHPGTEAAERVGDLDALPDRPDRPCERSVADVLEVGGLAAEGRSERAGIAQQDAADRLRQVEPLVRVDRERVDAVETGEEVRARGRRGGGSAVGAVHVQPHAVRCADVGERVERVDGAGARGAGDADHRDRRDAGGNVGLDRARELVGPDAEGIVAADRAQRPPAEAEDVAGALERVVHVLGRVDPAEPGATPCSRASGSARARAQARPVRLARVPPLVKCPPPAGEADQLGEPAPGDVLELRREARAAAEVGVERGREHRRGDARLESRAVDERERARVRMRVRARQHGARDVLDRGLEPLTLPRQRHAVGLALLVAEHAGGRQIADVATEGRGPLAGEHDRARGLLGRAERAHSPSAIGVPPCARMRDAKIAALRAPPIAMQPTGHARGHLRDREQGVHAAEPAGGDRHADHRQLRVSGDDARQRGCHAGAADQHADAAHRRALRIGRDCLGVAVRRDHADLVRERALVELGAGLLHDRAIGLGAHEDPDQRGGGLEPGDQVAPSRPRWASATASPTRFRIRNLRHVLPPGPRAARCRCARCLPSNSISCAPASARSRASASVGRGGRDAEHATRRPRRAGRRAAPCRRAGRSRPASASARSMPVIGWPVRVASG